MPYVIICFLAYPLQVLIFGNIVKNEKINLTISQFLLYFCNNSSILFLPLYNLTERHLSDLALRGWKEWWGTRLIPLSLAGSVPPNAFTIFQMLNSPKHGGDPR
jgi:hypothetical protein